MDASRSVSELSLMQVMLSLMQVTLSLMLVTLSLMLVTLSLMPVMLPLPLCAPYHWIPGSTTTKEHRHSPVLCLPRGQVL